ncbi:uncharacterized protein J3D65DRAFT_696181 [Phyllosticta citribraziliensis]|uniref:Putative zinc-finger domain-containing protein n=1 Tax=Phyllosticta citribraziliensis TaxID=989973 RepID=A0ABR1LPI1_9PEZI
MANWPPPPPSAPPHHGLPFHPGFAAQNGQSTPNNNGAAFQMPPFTPQTSQPTPNALAYQQNASFPPVALAAMDPAQVAAAIQQITGGSMQFPLPPMPPQSGFPPPPPPIPFGFPPPGNLPVPIPPQPLSTPHAASQHPLPTPPAPNNRVMEIANADKEEGELSDEPEPNARASDTRHSFSAQQSRVRDDRSAAGGDFYRPGKDGVAPTGSDARWTRNNRPLEPLQTDMEHNAGFGRYSSSARPRSPRVPAYGDNYSSMNSRGDESRRQSRSDHWRRASDHYEHPSQQYKSVIDSRSEEQPGETLSGKAIRGSQPTDPVPAQNIKEQAENFLRVLSACGFSLTDVKNYAALDSQILEDVWRSLGLLVDRTEHEKPPSHAPQKQIDATVKASNISLPAKPPAKAAEIKPAASRPAAAPRTVASEAKPEEKTAVGTSVSSRNSTASVASPPADRAAYIARLMAAKKNTSAAANKPAASAGNPTPAMEDRTATIDLNHPTQSQASPAEVGSISTAPSQSAPSQPAPQPLPNRVAPTQPVAPQTSTSQNVSDQIVQSTTPSTVANPGTTRIQTSQQPVDQKDLPAVDPAVLAAQKKQAQNELVRKRIEELKLQRQKADAEEAARAKAQAAVASANPNLRPSPATNGAALSQQMRASASLPARPAPLQAAAQTAMTRTPVQDDQVARTPPASVSPAGGIPGLMLAAPPVSQPFAPTISTPVLAGGSVKNRKRPVAADFDDVKPATPSAFKRPFGQSRYETGTEMMIIEVSDDEGSVEDVNEADDQLQQPFRASTQPQPYQSKQTATSGQYPPTTIDIPRPGMGHQNSAQVTPPASQTPGSAAHADSLRRKEEEIALLKRKLVERQRNLKSKGQPSRTGTPVNSGPVTQVSTPVQADSPGTAPGQSNGAAPSNMSPLTRALEDRAPSARERERSGSLLADRGSANPSPAPSDWKTRRRAEIESGLTAFDADLSKNMSRLEQLRREMEQLEEDNRRRQKEKNDLANELENLGIDTEGMAHEELQAKKEEIMQQKEEAREAEASMAQDFHEEKELSPNESLHAGADKSMANADDEDGGSQEHSIRENPTTTEQPQAQPEELSKSTEGQSSPRASSIMDVSEEESEDASDKTDAEMEMSDSEVDENFAAPEAIGESPESGEAGSQEQQQPAATGQLEADADSEDFYSPEPMPRASTPEAADDAMDIASDSSSSASSEADEEDYTPPGNDPVEVVQDQTSPNGGGDASSEAMDEGEDDYEPSDALPAAAHTSSPSPSETSVPKFESEHPSLRNFPTSASHSGSEAPSQTPEVTIITDDVAPELQSRPETSRDSSQARSTGDIKTQPFFTPYESPLKMFKAYRYHPSYTESVSGGFKSLTYSHEIDPMKPICPFEAAGGICNDPECDGQHFRGMGISEDKILLQLGIVNPGRTQEDQDLWRVGLRQILKSLREQGVKSGEAVAKAIADYRREFLKDPSRVLNL